MERVAIGEGRTAAPGRLEQQMSQSTRVCGFLGLPGPRTPKGVVA